MRSPRHVLIVAGLLFVVGLALVLFDSQTINGYSMGPTSDDHAYSSEVSFTFDGAWLVTKQALIGYALMWLGSVLAAGLVGYRVIARRQVSS
ncbi:hypothetical protein [Aeromicrobium sp. 9AM]|uniref:hypothetical protein n=1 Tax=Aeromicrobium sp. 9AM TaxID=2653126 RepID=UPI0012F3905D|nr:hypothetical protein [Aeromicrobium sp. 9AM]VXB90668.1 conserved hypothetical protein [Aeromicrobium sp. 9AM]